MFGGSLFGQASDGNSFSLFQGRDNNEHADTLLASVQSLRADNLAFDFFIHVNETVFPVHKLVLISFSEYFRAMLLNDNFEETKQGKVEMKNVEAFAMKEIVEYMYTGNCSVNMENLCAVLSCADILQLDKVKEICSKYMFGALSDENCVFFLQMASTHSNKSVVNQIEIYFRSKFFAVGSTDDFLQLEYADASKCIHEYGLKDIEAWKVGLAWVKHDISIREEHILGIVKLLRLVEYPSHELLKCMWEERIFKECPQCVDLILHRLFHDIKDLEENIETDNCIFLIQQARHYKHDKTSIRESIIKFMQDHLGELMAFSDFSNLHKDDVKLLLLADDTNYLSETTKWSAIHKWINVNSSDTDIFTHLFQSIRFNNIPIGFINDNVVDNPLLKDLCCYKDVLHRLCGRHIPSADSIALLSSDAEDNMYVIDMLTNELKKFRFPSGFVVGRAVVSVNGKLCLVVNSKMFFCTRGKKWLHLMDIPNFHVDTPITAVVELNDCIYILNKDITYVYKPISNVWTYNCGCRFNQFSATSSHNYLYVLSRRTGAIKRFNPSSCQWTVFTNVADKNLSHILFVNGELYVTDGRKWMQYSTVSYTWIEKLGFAAAPSQFQDLVVIGDKVLFLSLSRTRLSLQTLDLSCGVSSEKSFSVPDGPTSAFSNLKIVSACAFRNSESDQALQHSKRLKFI